MKWAVAIINLLAAVGFLFFGSVASAIHRTHSYSMYREFVAIGAVDEEQIKKLPLPESWQQTSPYDMPARMQQIGNVEAWFGRLSGFACFGMRLQRRSYLGLCKEAATQSAQPTSGGNRPSAAQLRHDCHSDTFSSITASLLGGASLWAFCRKMNFPEPIAVMRTWLVESEGALALPLSVSLGLDGNTDEDAVEAISKWIDLPRNPIELRTAEIMLRAFIDFECEIGVRENHQSFIDNELLSAVDSSVVPLSAREAINSALGSRPSQRERAKLAADSWRGVRPPNDAIYEWFHRRFQDFLEEQQQHPNR